MTSSETGPHSNSILENWRYAILPESATIQDVIRNLDEVGHPKKSDEKRRNNDEGKHNDCKVRKMNRVTIDYSNKL